MLYICATPIGNLGDITLRVLETLKSVDVIAAEDTRQTVKLLNHYEISKPMVSYHEHNRYEMTPVLVERMKKGEDIALVTDAGTPAISDPGEDLVRACHKSGVEVTSLPGATAFTTALTLSGMDARGFAFEGFLPQDRDEQRVVLDRLLSAEVSTIFYEAPHRLVKTLQLIRQKLEEDHEISDKRAITVCKELTKKHEREYFFANVKEACKYFSEDEEPKGEFVFIIAGRDRELIESREKENWRRLSVEEHMRLYTGQGMDKKEAMKRVALDRGVPKREIYKELIKGEEN